jgi:hypothetical protein
VSLDPGEAEVRQNRPNNRPGALSSGAAHEIERQDERESGLVNEREQLVFIAIAPRARVQTNEQARDMGGAHLVA